jgi:hypothetical protein
MVKPAPPLSNAERQRQFRARHPNYYHRYRARRKAAIAGRLAVMAAPAAAEPLALPAPVQMPLFPGLNAIPATPARAPQLVPISQPETMPAHQSLAA